MLIPVGNGIAEPLAPEPLPPVLAPLGAPPLADAPLCAAPEPPDPPVLPAFAPLPDSDPPVDPAAPPPLVAPAPPPAPDAPAPAVAPEVMLVAPLLEPELDPLPPKLLDPPLPQAAATATERTANGIKGSQRVCMRADSSSLMSWRGGLSRPAPSREGTLLRPYRARKDFLLCQWASNAHAPLAEDPDADSVLGSHRDVPSDGAFGLLVGELEAPPGDDRRERYGQLGFGKGGG